MPEAEFSVDAAQPLAGALVAPHALNFAQLFRLTGNLYSYRWDEAMRDGPANALAMRREAFYLALLWERWAPTMNLEWQAEVDDDNDPMQQVVRDGINRLWRSTPDRMNLIGWQLQATWYGRVANQVVWGRQPGKLWGVTYHEPVNGDGIQYQWDGTPVVLVHQATAARFRETDKDAVIWSSDRGAYGIRLYKPEYRRRFIINTHSREAADYFEGEMAGGVHGVGLRSWLYWSGWMRTEVLSWMFSFMQSTGMMDLVVFNFPTGNKDAEAAAERNAKKLVGKLALIMPRPAGGNWPAVEQIPMNTAGVEVLKSLIEDFYDKYAERLIVGQSMSSGADTDGSLGGTGKANFAKDTKYQLIKSDAMRLSESLSRDYAEPAKAFNWPWADFPVRLVPVLRDPDDDGKVERGCQLIDKGVTIEEDELRKAGGFRKPRPGQKILGGKSAMGMGGMPGEPMPGEDTPSLLDEADDASSVFESDAYQYAHAPAGGVTIDGTFYKGGEFIPGNVLSKAKPEDRAKIHHEGTYAEKLNALNMNRRISLTELREEFDKLELGTLTHADVKAIATELGYPGHAKIHKTKKGLVAALKTMFEGMKLSQHRADRIHPPEEPAPKTDGDAGRATGI